MSVIHPSIFIVLEGFPEHRDVIRRLYSSNKPFQSLCDNYLQCKNALRYWTTSKDECAPERQREYMTLADEMEIEILLYCMGDSDADDDARGLE